jgi:hypothetical protein
MRILSSAVLILAVAVNPSSLTGQRRPIPENPCELLSVEQLATATGLEIIGAERKPDISEIVRAQDENRSIGPGRLCVYKTETVFGDIMVGLSAERDPAKFRQARDIYFARFPGSAKPIPNLGQDAWIGGGANLHLFVRDDLQLTIGTQKYQKESEELLIRIARRLLTIW